MNNPKGSLSSLKVDILKIDNLKENITTVAQYAKEITGAQRFSLFVFDEEKDQLKSIYNDGVKGKIALKSNIGFIGYSFHKRISILENNPQTSSIFFKLADKKLNFHTKSVLTVPIIDNDNHRLGVIQLLNKEAGFNEEDKKSIEELSTLVVTVLDSSIHHCEAEKETQTNDEIHLKKLQDKFDTYLTDKKLVLKEDGSAYYKILDMKRDYFISASQCYLLEDAPKTIQIYYCSVTDDFLSLEMSVKINQDAKCLMVSEKIHTPTFTCYPLEKDEDT